MDKLDILVDLVQEMKTDIKTVLDDHEDRLRATETTINRAKGWVAALGAIATFTGLDTLKHHWPFK